MKGTGKRLTIAMCLMIAMCSACQTVEEGREQWSALTTVEQAMKADEILLKTLDDLKDSIGLQYAAYRAAGDQEGMTFIEDEVAPLVNAAESAIAAYHSAVTTWLESGMEPSDLEARLMLARKALDLVERMIINRGQGEVK
jgi:hypothetical protein